MDIPQISGQKVQQSGIRATTGPQGTDSMYLHQGVQD